MTRGLTFRPKHANFKYISKNISFESERGWKVIQKPREKIFSKKKFTLIKNLTYIRPKKSFLTKRWQFTIVFR